MVHVKEIILREINNNTHGPRDIVLEVDIDDTAIQPGDKITGKIKEENDRHQNATSIIENYKAIEGLTVSNSFGAKVVDPKFDPRNQATVLKIGEEITIKITS